MTLKKVITNNVGLVEIEWERMHITIIVILQYLPSYD